MFRQLFEENDLHRNENSIGPLVGIETLCSKRYELDVFTVIPEGWQKFEALTQHEYKTRFESRFPLAQLLLENVKNIVVAGGSANMPLTFKSYYVVLNKIDIDIFIYGIDDITEFWKKVTEIEHFLIDNSKKWTADTNSPTKSCKIKIKRVVKNGLIILYISNIIGQAVNNTEYQIILRKFKTISSILYSFDIPCSSVYYDGYNAYTTKLGAFSIEHQINLINTRYRSYTFEKRIMKYFNRGYGFGFCEFLTDNIVVNSNIDMPFISIYLEYNLYKKVYFGKLFKTVKQYGGKTYSFGNNYDEYKEIPKTYKIFLRSLYMIEHIGIITTVEDPIDYNEFSNEFLWEIIEKYKVADDVIFRLLSNILNVPINKLNKFNDILSTESISKLKDLLFMNDETEMMEKMKELIMYEIKKYADYKPNWIFVNDNEKEFSGSVMPIIEDPEKWYGEYYCKSSV